jgi:serine protease Do
MLKTTEEVSAKLERRVLRKVYVLFAILTVFGLFAGIGIGVAVSERRATANESPNAKTAESISASFSDVAKRVEPAVVNIDTKGKVPDIQLKGETSEGSSGDDLMEYFKRQLPRRPSYAVGSGFIVDKTGYILTNSHVVDDASRITVRLQSGEEFVAKVIGMDTETDLAVLKIDAGRELPSVKLGDSNTALVGDWVLAIGSPFGLAQTVTAGIISQTKRETPQSNSFQKFIQTDAAINRGNSGGPLVNMSGEVIGVNSQIATSTGDYNGIGFALPSNEAANVYQQILKQGKVRRGYLGINLDTVKPEFAKVYEMPDLKGAIITRMIDKSSRAALAGLQVGDIIIELNGERVESSQDLITKISAIEPEKDTSVTFLREVNNKLEPQTLSVKLAERPAESQTVSGDDPPKKLNNGATAIPLGLTLQDMPAQPTPANKFEGLKGVLVKDVDPASAIADIKRADGRNSAIREGDLIMRINRVNVADMKSFNEIASKLKTGDAVVLHVANYNARTKTFQPNIVQFTVQ